jgi:hypothetical protein
LGAFDFTPARRSLELDSQQRPAPCQSAPDRANRAMKPERRLFVCETLEIARDDRLSKLGRQARNRIINFKA